MNYLYSIRPQHILNIARGDKTYELRTKLPREMKEAINKGEKVVMWIYCTKAEPYLYTVYGHDINLSFEKKICEYNEDGEGCCFNIDEVTILNGLVVAKCVVDGYEEIKLIEGCFHDEFIYTTYPRLLKQLCLTDNEVTIYGKGKPLYALHLTQVEILDKPMTVQDFGLTRAPQSYQKVIAPEGKE